MKSTNMLERLKEEIKHRTHVVRILPNEASCLRLIRGLAVEQHEDWIEAMRYLNMSLPKERKKQMLLRRRIWSHSGGDFLTGGGHLQGEMEQK